MKNKPIAELKVFSRQVALAQMQIKRVYSLDSKHRLAEARNAVLGINQDIAHKMARLRNEITANEMVSRAKRLGEYMKLVHQEGLTPAEANAEIKARHPDLPKCAATWRSRRDMAYLEAIGAHARLSPLGMAQELIDGWNGADKGRYADFMKCFTPMVKNRSAKRKAVAILRAMLAWHSKWGTFQYGRVIPEPDGGSSVPEPSIEYTSSSIPEKKEKVVNPPPDNRNDDRQDAVNSLSSKEAVTNNNAPLYTIGVNVTHPKQPSYPIKSASEQALKSVTITPEKQPENKHFCDQISRLVNTQKWKQLWVDFGDAKSPEIPRQIEGLCMGLAEKQAYSDITPSIEAGRLYKAEIDIYGDGTMKPVNLLAKDLLAEAVARGFTENVYKGALLLHPYCTNNRVFRIVREWRDKIGYLNLLDMKKLSLFCAIAVFRYAEYNTRYPRGKPERLLPVPSRRRC